MRATSAAIPRSRSGQRLAGGMASSRSQLPARISRSIRAMPPQLPIGAIAHSATAVSP
jgi:hypothetical protein